MTYTTLDFLPDLTPSDMNGADRLSLLPIDDAPPYDFHAFEYGNEPYAILHAIYRFEAFRGATYSFISTSYFDPFVVIVYDQHGNAIVANNENDDPADWEIPDGGFYSVDSIYGWVAPYTGTYYVDASWHQGSYYKSYALSVFEDLDTALLTKGTAGDDVFNSAMTSGRINGMGGVDTVIYSGKLGDYEITRTVEAKVAVSSLGPDDLLENVEKLRFSDMEVNLTIQDAADGTPAADLKLLEELYVAFFNRIPDADGLEYWIGQLADGMSVTQIADAFYAAGVGYPELTGFSRTMSNADFVNVVYKNVLGRTDGADAEGLAYWSGALDRGAETKGSLVQSILGSAHTFKGDATWGWVADLLDNKAAVADTFAVDMGLNYLSAQESISKGIQIAAAVTPTDTSAAIALIGIDPSSISLF